jgi:hypothetical protein
MKVGDLVTLRGNIWSSYGHEGEFGLFLGTELSTKPPGAPPDVEFSRVLWGIDGEVKLYKTEHLEVV